MIILTNCLGKNADEGSLKVAASLIRQIKPRYPQTTVISYGNASGEADINMPLNKLFLNRKLISLLRRKQEDVLYIPFSSNTTGSVLRTWMLSCFARKRVKAVFVLQRSMNAIARMLLKGSGAQVVALSKEAYGYYHRLVGDRAIYLKTGVDLQQFQPVTPQRKQQLREKHGIAPGKKIVLHVGHLKRGRNITQLLKLGEDYHAFVVVSSTTTNQQDEQLRKNLTNRPNTTIIDSYLTNIEEIYQMADVYFFPVQEKENCIDVPLSALEAAACGIPVVTTDYGEMKELIGKNGFYPIESFAPAALDELLHKAAEESISPRQSIEEYDWSHAVDYLMA